MTQRVKVAFVLAVAAAVGAAVVMSACESVPLTAAPGTILTLDAHPNFVMANGGTSVVTAILVEPAGTFVPDGTEVFFFTTLGRVDASGKSVNGVVRVNFVSDSRSGTAEVRAVSGGPAPEPSATPTASPTPNPTPTPAGLLDVQASDGSSSGAPDFEATTGQNSATVQITVGNALANRVQVAANPPILANNRSTTIVATVFDQSGNPIQNVPVYFSLGNGASLEVLESGGAPRFTDSNGQAFDVLRTKAPYDPTLPSAQRTVTVVATTANGKAEDVTVTVNSTASRT
jgi:hypothetical protein